MQTITRTTPCGALQGLELEDHLEYRGIRYATAARWEYPRPVEHWEGVLRRHSIRCLLLPAPGL